MVSSILVRPDQKRRPRQSLSFAEEESSVVLEVESCFDYPDDVREALYYSRSDYQFSRSSAKVIAKESERYGHSAHLDDSYISSYDQSVQEALNIWCLHGHCRRGLERWSNRWYGQERKDDQFMYIQGLLRAQAEMKLKDEYSDERLREVSHVLSRKARIHAQMLGEADSNAAKWEFGMVDARSGVPATQGKRNLGLVGKVNPVSDIRGGPAAGPAAGRPRFSNDTRAVNPQLRTPQMRIRSKSGQSGRVPRIA